MKFSLFFVFLLYGCEAQMKNENSKDEEMFSYKENIIMEKKDNPIPQELYTIPAIQINK